MTSDESGGGTDVYVIAEMCVTAHQRCVVWADLELFIVLIIPKFAEEFCGLTALNVLAWCSDKGFINKYRNALYNSSFWALFAGVVFKAS